jgi:nitrate/nitrite transporter NarK
LCFAAWGLIGALAGTFQTRLGLSGTETAFLVAVPVLLGSLGRLPMGILADRLGGRMVFTILMVSVGLAAALVPAATTYGALIAAAFALGLAGSSFAVGVAFVSRWTPPERQGTTLGLYALGNGGQSIAVFLGPVVAAWLGWETVFRGTAVLLLAWAGVFGILARDAPPPPDENGPVARRMPLNDSRLWLLAAIYFLTFGGFVAFAIYLPTLLADEFGLSPGDAGLRAAGFVVLATATRPLGGWLADRLGGALVLSIVLFGVTPFALLLAWPAILPFTVGALGCAALMGLGNGAVFKLVPACFPLHTGAVTGLVGAVGGLGGFFPPLLLGALADRAGVRWPGFVLLAATTLLLWEGNRRLFVPVERERALVIPPDLTRAADRLRAGAWASLWTGLLVAAIVVGSRNLQNFDAALVIYTFAVIFATWGVAYHYHVWLQKPPTRRYWERTLELLRQEGLQGAARLTRFAGTHLAGQGFIYERSPLRWWMHQLIFWGCLLAVAITFPLVFGWVHFETRPDDQMRYVTYLFGFPTMSFAVRTVTSWLIFHGLDVSAVLVLAGVTLALARRMRDQGAQAVQAFARDLFPLLLLVAISVTGLALTASVTWLRGSLFPFLALLHAITVVAALLYLPFGKFFHIFQRPAQLGVKLYHEVGSRDPGASCRRCGERFASAMHLEDLKAILPELGFDYRSRGGSWHWQEFCPACKRIVLATAQLRLMEGPRGAAPRS